jgi:hypothetical protein
MLGFSMSSLDKSREVNANYLDTTAVSINTQSLNNSDRVSAIKKPSSRHNYIVHNQNAREIRVAGNA